jgi:tRNA pseudouridine55 synthase
MTDGFLVIDKPGGITSHDVVAKIRKRFKTKRVGHAGTLDPMATGVLVVGIGNATKLLQYIVEGRKSYDATISFGSSTHTDDKEGDVISTASAQEIDSLSDEAIQSVLNSFVGKIMQRPSSVSAIKVDGVTAHERVRRGEKVELPAREVEIFSLTIYRINRSAGSLTVDIGVDCSTGTYIRAIARDAGDALNVGGHLTSLRRTIVEPFTLKDAGNIESAELITTASGISRVMPTRIITSDEMKELGFGRQLPLNSSEGLVAAITSAGEFVALLINKELMGKSGASPIYVALKDGAVQE